MTVIYDSCGDWFATLPGHHCSSLESSCYVLRQMKEETHTRWGWEKEHGSVVHFNIIYENYHSIIKLTLPGSSEGDMLKIFIQNFLSTISHRIYELLLVGFLCCSERRYKYSYVYVNFGWGLTVFLHLASVLLLQCNIVQLELSTRTNLPLLCSDTVIEW